MKMPYSLPTIISSGSCVKEFLHTLPLLTQSSQLPCGSLFLTTQMKNSVAGTATFQTCLSISAHLQGSQHQLTVKVLFLLHCLRISSVFSTTVIAMQCIATLPKISMQKLILPLRNLHSSRRNTPKVLPVILTICVAPLTHMIIQPSSTVDVHCMQYQMLKMRHRIISNKKCPKRYLCK
jgi:hypothetical protein